ncbi:MAG: NAD(P)-dependent oxidoreductase [Chloroflexota bacterium]|nr:NAD(P)-dependent oxidoreductase [Chloroflexota bacterium]MDE2685476.1 NAD(P)-dependent oxidoreductase [Chloroflexota bacterium]
MTLPQKQAFIGVGTMGSLMAGCLLDAGVDLTVFDVRREAADPLIQRGARWAASAEDAASVCDMLWTSLPGPTQVESVLLGNEGAVLSAMADGAVLVDTTTNDPDVARRVASACAAQNLAMLDAPVSGRPPAMTMMVGGDHAVYEKALPSLEAVAAQIFYVGPAGAGCVAKLATQYMGYTNLIAAIEGMLIARMGGVDPAVLAEIVPVSAGASRAFNAIPNAVLDGSFQAGGTLDIVAKDVALACELARRLEAPSSTGQVADSLYRQAQEAGWGSEGYPIVARILEAMAQTELRSE